MAKRTAPSRHFLIPPRSANRHHKPSKLCPGTGAIARAVLQTLAAKRPRNPCHEGPHTDGLKSQDVLFRRNVFRAPDDHHHAHQPELYWPTLTQHVCFKRKAFRSFAESTTLSRYVPRGAETRTRSKLPSGANCNACTAKLHPEGALSFHLESDIERPKRTERPRRQLSTAMRG